ncbi:uncharacterized protein LOC134460793 [Engraulis encrasicolus]|uniref:uncharacterized protein LOC134460793 n=1 Tax=Engraulis encrasicolus TaxID=184585 RepID=UPI002FD39E9D
MHREQTNGFIILCIFAGFAYASGAGPLIVDPTRHAPCHGNLSLSCSLSTPEPPTYIYMSWVIDTQPLCKVTDGVVEVLASDIDCHYDSQLLRLTATVLQQGPLSQGEYTCKMRSNLGANYNNTTVTPPACTGSFQHTSLEQPAREGCLFYDVYPDSRVYWFSNKDNTNLTASSIDNRSVRGDNGLYNISSELPREGIPGDVRCSLGYHNSSHLIQARIQPMTFNHLESLKPTESITGSPITGSGVCPGLHRAFLWAGLALCLWQ